MKFCGHKNPRVMLRVPKDSFFNKVTERTNGYNQRLPCVKGSRHVIIRSATATPKKIKQ